MLLLATLGLLASFVHAVPTISTKGAKFFTSDGNQFFLKGVAYQLLPNDPLIDGDQCKRDSDLMKTLGVNSIRVYHVDPHANHDACMQTLADAGIYLWLDLDTFDSYIMGPGIAEPQWNMTQYKAYQTVLDAFHKYDNLGGVFVGNEVLTSPDTNIAAPYVKAAASDLKAYRDGKGYRKIPVGYTGADIASLRPMLQDYLACGQDSANAVDFYGLNAYEWCGQSTYETSGYVQLQNDAAKYSVPIFFSETGCNVGGSRTFDDQAAIFGDKMVNTWSGAIIYEWIQETNQYGLVTYEISGTSSAGVSGEDATYGRSGTPTPVSPDFENLSRHWATLTPTGVRESDYKPSLSAPPCPDFTSSAWEVKADATLPTIGYGTSTASSQSGSGTSTPATLASATGKAQTGGGEAEQTRTSATESEATGTAAAASSSIAAASALGYPEMSWNSWVWAYVALCGVAGAFFVL